MAETPASGATDGVVAATPGPHAEFALVYITCSTDAAPALARELVRSGMAACVTRHPIVSTYTWQGALCEDEPEIQLTVKTRGDAAWRARFTEFVRRHHPYAVPEVLFVPVLDGNPAYLAWLQDSTRIGAGETPPASTTSSMASGIAPQPS